MALARSYAVGQTRRLLRYLYVGFRRVRTFEAKDAASTDRHRTSRVSTTRTHRYAARIIGDHIAPGQAGRTAIQRSTTARA